MSKALHSGDFQPHLHTAFRIDGPIPIELQLAEMTDTSNAAIEQFSLIFTGPPSVPLQQGTYTLQHPVLGEQNIFMVPLGPQGALMRYQAVFSRLL
jgi:hypothetical protein